MIYPKIPLAQSIIAICHAKGIEHIVISPGSRNAPLTIGFTQNANFTCYSIADERCAGFFALGIAQQTKKPVVLVCTSGSALLNYYPAFSEAFYSKIPLLVISADRPKNKVDIGDGQTIRQENVFQNHSVYNANLTEEANEDNDKKINDAINKSFSMQGPSHINAPFEEPLYETVSKLQLDTTIEVLGTNYKTIPLEDIIAATNIWNTSKRKMILVGVLEPNSIEIEIINELANDPSVIVLVEATSNLQHPKFVANIDALITPFSENEKENFRPEVLLTFGGMIVSKRIKEYLRNHPPFNHWHVDRLLAYDTFGCLSHHFEAQPNDFFSQFLPYVKTKMSDYQKKALDLLKYRQQKHEDYLSKISFSDLKVFDMVFKSLPKNSQLQIGNSSSIRYAQLFAIDQSIEIFCNRGTSGIDGSTSTAIGAATVSNKETIFITGDISFFYDSNALWNNYIPSNFKIIVINNGGGGIFRILPGHKEEDVFHTYFETSHCLTAEHLAKMYRFDYQFASTTETLKEALTNFYGDTTKPKILEIFTPTLENDKILKQYFKAIG